MADCHDQNEEHFVVNLIHNAVNPGSDPIETFGARELLATRVIPGLVNRAYGSDAGGRRLRIHFITALVASRSSSL